ncbi:SAVED domain-containing protein [Saccharothrix saharensis]|uniref:SAVED domain-containing protein n=1 Tax=Saccharothrix saharensis TaxID=571190 RepID=UPI0036CD60B2
MNAPTPAAGPPSRSGVRRSGDHYQDLVTWGAALRVIQPRQQFTGLEMEINGVGNVDDIVLRHLTAGDHYSQVKWATNPALLVDDTFLTQRKTKNSKSVLEKIFASYRKLRDPGRPPRLELLTNRVLDPQDPLLGKVDGRTDLLVPHARLAAPGTAAGSRVTAWAEHVGASRDHILEMFDHLVFRTGLTVSSERDRAQTLMVAAGLRHDDEALDAGITAVAGWIRDGAKSLSADELHHRVAELGLHQDDPRAILLVQAIDRDLHPEDATEVLDWVDLYEGDSAMTRCQPKSSRHWRTMADELREAVTRLRQAGVRDVLVRGALRQATFFAVGAELAQVTGRAVSYVQHGVLWSSASPRRPVPTPSVRRIELGPGGDLAVAVGIAVDPSTAVASHLAGSSTEVGELVVVLPRDGAHDQVVAGPGEAVAYAQEVRNIVRAELERRPALRIHLFLAGPGGLALLLGHRWNRLAPTTVYEHLGPGRGYVPAFDVAA